MKSIITIAASGRMALTCLLIAALTSCGGGSGSATTSSAKSVLTSFLQISPPAGFFWSTSKPSSVAITLSRNPSARLGNLTVLVSNYLCNGGANPVHAGLFASYSLLPIDQIGLSAKVGLASETLQIPAATALVLVEVVDNSRGIALVSQLVAPAALATLTLQVPDVPALSGCPG
jgi:hypothetical protein